MERPPYDDPDDLDFNFGSSRRRADDRELTGDRDAVDPPAEKPPSFEQPAERPAYEDEPSGELPPASEEDFLDPDTVERRALARRRRERPSSGALRLPRFGRKRAASSSETGERRRLRDDPHTPAEVPVPGSRRDRHRDLPAKVRRRQAIGLGVIVVLVLGGGIALASSIFGGGGDSDEPTPLKKLIGQSVIGKLGKEGPDQKLLKRVRKGQVGGFIVSPRNEATLAEQLAQVNQAAEDGDNPPLLIMVDQEGGEVSRLPGPPDVSPKDLGEGGDPEAARSEGEKTGTYLAGLGINVDLAPVLDVQFSNTADTIADRTFGEDPQLVADLGSAFIEGMQSQGVAATAKHFPGLGPATVNTDFAPVTIAARQDDLDASLVPFQAAVAAGVELMMVSSAIYPAYGGKTANDPNKPAPFTKTVVQGLLRTDLGFDGVIITDDLQSIAIQELSSPGNAAVASLGAGCDLLLFARSDEGAVVGFNSVVAAAKADKLTRDQIQAAYDRVTALKSDLSSD